jgi:hypothetical protein
VRLILLQLHRLKDSVLSHLVAPQLVPDREVVILVVREVLAVEVHVREFVLNMIRRSLISVV